MRRLALLVMVCGCNQAFNLESTKLIDAPPQIPPVDAPPPPVCPAIGTVPRFSDDLRQIPPRTCEAYSVSENQVAMGWCNGRLVRGAADAEMTQEIVVDPAYAYDYPRLAPDGNHVFFSHYAGTGTDATVTEFAWTGTELVQGMGYAPPVDTTYGETFEISTPSRGPDRHIIYGDFNNTTNLWDVVEIADGSGAFTETQRYPLSDLGADVYMLHQPSLSPDGLRMVFIASQPYVYGGGMTNLNSGLVGGPGGCGYSSDVVMYADRPTKADKFGTAVALETVPDQVSWPYMTQDCGRIYVAALNRIFYFKQ